MAIQSVDLGNAPTGAGGDTFRSAATKINANFSDVTHAASKNIGTSGGTVPLLNTQNTWANTQFFQTLISIGGSAAYPGVKFIARDTVDASTIGFSTTLETSSGTSFYVSYRDRAESSTGRVTIYFPRTAGTLALATSDERIKDKVSIVDESECIERLHSLELWNYTMKKEMSTNPEVATYPKRGFMAQQANSVDQAYALPPQSDEDYWGIDDRAIIADLVGAIRVLQKEINILKGVDNEPE